MSTVEDTASLAAPDFSFFHRMYIRSTLLLKRFIQTMTTLSTHLGASISAASADNAERQGIGGLLDNSAVNEENVMDCYRLETLHRMKETGQNVFLCVQDTTGVSYGQREKTAGLGEYNGTKAKGLLTHSALLLTSSGLPLKKLILMYSIIAVKIQHLTYLARQQPDAPYTEVISEEEWHVLYRIAYKDQNGAQATGHRERCGFSLGEAPRISGT